MKKLIITIILLFGLSFIYVNNVNAFINFGDIYVISNKDSIESNESADFVDVRFRGINYNDDYLFDILENVAYSEDIGYILTIYLDNPYVYNIKLSNYEIYNKYIYMITFSLRSDGNFDVIFFYPEADVTVYRTNFNVSIEARYGYESYEDSYNKGYNKGFGDGFDEGYDEGYDNGVIEGYDNGYDNGYDEGYNNGFIEGINEADTTYTGVFNLVVGGLLGGMSSFMNTELFPNFPIGVIVLIPLIFGLIAFIVGGARKL